MRVVIAGGPYCGKTSLVSELAAHGFVTISEAALMVITEEQKRGNPTPWMERVSFQQKILALQKAQHASVNGELTIFDRGIPDGLAYYYLDGFEPPEEGVQAAREHRYDIVFIPELLPEYVPGKTRGESLERREKIHSLITESYKTYGYDPVIIPGGSIQDRVAFVKKYLESLK